LGGQLAARWLQSRGCKRPVYLSSPPKGDGPSHRRWEGFKDYLHSVGIEPELMTTDFDGTSHDFMEKGYKLTKDFFKLPKNASVDGVFYLCDEMALGGVRALRELGKDLPVIGFDGWEPSEYLGIATLEQPARQMGIDGAQLLIRLLNGGVQETVHNLYQPILRELKVTAS